MKNIITATLLLLFTSCKPVGELPSARLRADGASWPASKLDEHGGLVVNAIKAACADPKGAASIGLRLEECYLIVAGAAVRESSWDPYKSAEAWGQEDNKCYGLTQSRVTDTAAVELSCDPTSTELAGVTCNALTGLRNLGCKADGGSSCEKWGSRPFSIETGVKKHLGNPNQGNLGSYIQDMEAVYNRSDVQEKFGIDSSSIRPWSTVFKTPLEGTAGDYDYDAGASGAQQNIPSQDYSSAFDPYSSEGSASIEASAPPPSFGSSPGFQAPESGSSGSSQGGFCSYLKYCWDWKTFRWHPDGTEGDGYRCSCGTWNKI